MSSMIGSSGMRPATGANNNMKGTGYNAVSTLSPEQMQLFQQMFSGGAPGLRGGLENLSQMAQGGNEDYWNKLEGPANRKFGALQGNLASRFSGMGTGARKSSGFQNTLGGASADFSERLQSNRMGLQQQAIRDLLGMSQNLLGKETQAFIPEKKPWWEEATTALSGGVGQGLGMLPGFFI